eukprot:3663476-Pyramimonas_sp.AAC.1
MLRGWVGLWTTPRPSQQASVSIGVTLTPQSPNSSLLFICDEACSSIRTIERRRRRATTNWCDSNSAADG